MEVPTEHLHEQLHHSAAAGERWIAWVALSSAILAVFAAVAALLAAHHVDEALIARIQSSDQWAYFQAKSVKASVLTTKIELLQALGRRGSEKDSEKLDEYRKEQKEISEKAEHLERDSERHLEHHRRLASGVTMFQIAIALGAIAALSKKRNFWHLSLAFGVTGIYFLIRSVLVG